MITSGREQYRDVGHGLTWIHHENQEVKTLPDVKSAEQFLY